MHSTLASRRNGRTVFTQTDRVLITTIIVIINTVSGNSGRVMMQRHPRSRLIHMYVGHPITVALMAPVDLLIAC